MARGGKRKDRERLDGEKKGASSHQAAHASEEREVRTVSLLRTHRTNGKKDKRLLQVKGGPPPRRTTGELGKKREEEKKEASSFLVTQRGKEGKVGCFLTVQGERGGANLAVPRGEGKKKKKRGIGVENVVLPLPSDDRQEGGKGFFFFSLPA